MCINDHLSFHKDVARPEFQYVAQRLVDLFEDSSATLEKLKKKKYCFHHFSLFLFLGCLFFLLFILFSCWSNAGPFGLSNYDTYHFSFSTYFCFVFLAVLLILYFRPAVFSRVIYEISFFSPSSHTTKSKKIQVKSTISEVLPCQREISIKSFRYFYIVFHTDSSKFNILHLKHISV